ncbi:MAG: hypothetical protein IPM77_09120 [Crocinitomicaceae bacterium]|nr:hypothetical protein [Crocinitomicaceae bacterium]
MILVFLLSHFYVAGFSQGDLKKQHLFGQIQKIVETEFDVMPSEDGTVISTLQQKWNEFYYDENGNLTGWVDIYYNGNVSSYYKKEYDSTGNLIAQIFYTPDHAMTGSISYSYNKSGLEINWVRKDLNGNVIYKWENFYNKKGYRIKSCSYTKKSTPDYTYQYQYNKQGNRTEEQWFDSTQTKIKTISIQYDQFGNQTCITTYDGKMNFVNQWNKKYNTNRKIILAVQKNSEDDPGVSYVYEYDSLGNVTSVMQYDSKGEIVKSTGYLYEYDENSNWVKKTEYYFDVPVKAGADRLSIIDG